MLDYCANILNLTPLEEKWFRIFGWEALTVNGHDLRALHPALVSLKSAARGGPAVLIADTIKGNGVPRLESGFPLPYQGAESRRDRCTAGRERMIMEAKFQRDAVIYKIHEAMATDESIFFVSADFGAPSLDRLREEFELVPEHRHSRAEPDQYCDRPGLRGLECVCLCHRAFPDHARLRTDTDEPLSFFPRCVP